MGMEILKLLLSCSEVACQEWEARLLWKKLDKYYVIYCSADTSSFHDGVSRSITTMQFIYSSPLSLLVALAKPIYLYKQKDKQEKKKKNRSPISFVMPWQWCLKALSQTQFFTYPWFSNIFRRFTVLVSTGQRCCPFKILIIWLTLLRQGRATEYGDLVWWRSTRGRNRPRMRGVRGQWGQSGGGSAWRITLRAPFVSMLMDRLTSVVPGLPMDDDVCRVYGGESRVQEVCGKSEFHAGQKPINFHSNTLKHYFPYIYLFQPMWFIGTGVFALFKRQHWQDITRTCCNLSNPGVPTCKNLCQATKFDLKNGFKRERGGSMRLKEADIRKVEEQ